MSVERFRQCLTVMNLPAADVKWFPKWVRRYAGWLKCSRREPLAIDEADVIRFLKSLRASDVPAW